MARIKDSIFIDAPPEKVHAFAADPHKWSSWFVGLGEAKSVEGDNSPGTVITQSYLMAGMHIPLTTKVIENRTEADGSFHWKGENEGSLAGWISWDYEPKDNGTMVTFEIEYAVPGSVLGKVADRLFIERNQERAARLTLENLKELTEA
jgi:coenzyme Q-binding protein COQ10